MPNHRDWRQIGGYRLSSAVQRKLQRVTGEQWLLAPDRRLGAANSCAGRVGCRTQIILIWAVLGLYAIDRIEHLPHGGAGGRCWSQPT